MSDIEFLLLLGLLLMAIAGLLVLAWRDFVVPRQERQIRREKRWEARRLGKIRSLVSARLWQSRKYRRLTDQRKLGRGKVQPD